MIKNSVLRTLILIFIISILFKPTWLFNNGTLTDEVDDLSYWLHSATLAFDFDFDYSYDYQITKDTINSETNAPYHAPGSGYMSAPFVFIFSLIDLIIDNEPPDRINPVNTYSYAGYFTSTLFYSFLGFYFIKKISTNLKKNEVGLVLFITFLSTLVHFSTTRFLMAHAHEFFLVSYLVHIFEKNHCKTISAIELYKILIGFFFLSITRPSTFLFSLLFFAIYKIKLSRNNLSYLKGVFFSSSLIVIYLFLAQTIYQENSIGLNLWSNNTTKGYLSDFNLDRVFEGITSMSSLFFSPSMGIVWCTPVVFFGILVLFTNKKNNEELRRPFIFLYLFAYFLVIFVWQGNEVAYGQRLLIGLLPFLCVRILKLPNLKYFKRPLQISTVLTYLGYVYFYSSENLTLKVGENLFGNITKWAAEDYYIYLFNELLNIENIISVLSRTIYAVNIFKFFNFDSIANFISQYIILEIEKVNKIERYVDSYQAISPGYFFVVTIVIVSFSYFFQRLLRDY
jgi:hypothetical protein